MNENTRQRILKYCFSVLAVGVLLMGLSALVPNASADIFAVEQAGPCAGGGSTGGGLCASNGSGGYVPYTLTAALALLTAPGAISNGTLEYVVTDNIVGDSFSFVLNSTGQPGNGGAADNATCQIKGGASSLFNACTIVNGDGQSTSLGGSQINDLLFPATITFSDNGSLFGDTFNLEFVSMQGTSETMPLVPVPSPEPSTLSLLGMALFGLVGLAAWRKADTVQIAG